MNSAGLESLYFAAVADVRQPHLDRMVSVGIAPATIARVGSAHPPFGVLCGQVEASGLFLPGDGQPHVVQPVIEHGALIDLVAWRVSTPARWGLVTGLGWLLNADWCFASRWDGERLPLHPSPLAWWQSGAEGGCVLDWDSPDLCWLRGFDPIDCSDDMLAATLRRALSKPVRLPRIRAMEVRNVA